MYQLRSRHVVPLLMVGLMMGCGGDGNGTTEPDPQPQPLVIVLAAGDGQAGTVGQPVPDPLVVQVTRGGQGVSGTAVSWSVNSGGGSVSPTNSTTDATGMASTTWTLGPTAGANGAQASGSGTTGGPVPFSATAFPNTPPPNNAAVSVGDNFFNPSTERVAAGGTVTWTWNGQANHNVTFGSGTNSATQSAGMFARAFPDAGSFDYVCTIHGSAMSGKIVVQ